MTDGMESAKNLPAEILDELIKAYKDMKQRSLAQAKLMHSYELRTGLIIISSECDEALKNLYEIRRKLDLSTNSD